MGAVGDKQGEAVNHEANEQPVKSKPKPKRKCTPGVLFELSQACCKTACVVASTRVFVTMYDNVNLMIKIAEQILGRLSEHLLYNLNFENQ